MHAKCLKLLPEKNTKILCGIDQQDWNGELAFLFGRAAKFPS